MWQMHACLVMSNHIALHLCLLLIISAYNILFNCLIADRSTCVQAAAVADSSQGSAPERTKQQLECLIDALLKTNQDLKQQLAHERREKEAALQALAAMSEETAR